jgi:hypothetical protein
VSLLGEFAIVGSCCAKVLTAGHIDIWVRFEEVASVSLVIGIDSGCSLMKVLVDDDWDAEAAVDFQRDT